MKVLLPACKTVPAHSHTCSPAPACPLPACPRYLVERAAALRTGGRTLDIIDRCNLTVLLEPGQEDLPAFLAQHQVGEEGADDGVRTSGSIPHGTCRGPPAGSSERLAGWKELDGKPMPWLQHASRASTGGA